LKKKGLPPLFAVSVFSRREWFWVRLSSPLIGGVPRSGEGVDNTTNPPYPSLIREGILNR